MEEANENNLLCYEAAVDEGVREVGDGHCVVVQPIQHLVNVQLIFLDFFFGALLVREGPQFEVTVIHVSHGVTLTTGTLLNVLALDVVIVATSKHLLED
jgi:hypothetical protein